MDPLSISLAVFSLVQLTLHVGKLTIAYQKGVKGFEKEIGSLHTEIKTLRVNLVALATSIEAGQEDGMSLPGQLDEDAIVELQKPIKECEAEIEELVKLLEKQTKHGKKFLKMWTKKLKWPMTVKETNEMITKLHRYQGHFSMRITIEARYVHISFIYPSFHEIWRAEGYRNAITSVKM